MCCVDYNAATRGIPPSIEHGNIQPSIKDSDDCLIYVDLRDEITSDDGRKLRRQRYAAVNASDGKLKSQADVRG
ncbi:hypothetical protein EDD16DRAFT_1632136 [Pisolithus croceorrhizus]|nr:hypothetical protein EDD16DRAFT_1632136 [Pisolithus croceorrhizus]